MPPARAFLFPRAIYFRAHFAFYQLICNCFIVSFFNSTATLTIAWASVQFFFLAHRARRTYMLIQKEISLLISSRQRFTLYYDASAFRCLFKLVYFNWDSICADCQRFSLVFVCSAFVSFVYETICFAKASNT